MEKLLEENKTLTQIVNDTRRPPVHPDGFHQSISRNFLYKVKFIIYCHLVNLSKIFGLKVSSRHDCCKSTFKSRDREMKAKGIIE